MTHAEIRAGTGEPYLEKILENEYDLLWISTPSDWHVRIPSKATTIYWKNLQTWITKTVTRNIKTILYVV